MSRDLARAPYRNPALPLAERVQDLLGRMTLAEKLAQLGCVWSTSLADEKGFSPEKAAEKLQNGTGHVTRIGASTGLRPHESAAFMNRIQLHLVEETRLGIPALVHEESTAGFTARDADQFPQAIGLASTWDPEGVGAAAAVIREQMRAVGARQTLAPVLDIARDPRWGRVEETYGEDPYLAARLGVAYVAAIQGEDRTRGVVATGKHFLGYGLSEGGHNHKPAHIGPRLLREVYARPFLAAIQEAGLASMMNAYNEIDGLPCGGSAEILDELLRGELGFDGVVVADYFTTLLLIASHRVAGDKGAAGQMALEAGLDVELPALDCYGEPLRERVEQGLLDERLVDRSVARLLRMKLELGLFEQPTVDEARASEPYQTPASRALSRELAARSMVLLRNQADLLPLDPSLACVAVLGPCADDVRLLQGDYHYPAHLEMIYEAGGSAVGAILPRADETAFAPGPYFPPTVTPLAGIRAAVSDSTRVVTARGCEITGEDRSGLAEAVALAAEADVAVVCVGGKSGLTPSCTVGEFRDAADLRLTGLQEDLVRALAETGTPIVVVLISGRVHTIPELAESAGAVVQAWVPGQEGGSGLADVLFGVVNPSGRLPVSMPRGVGQVPIYHSRHWGMQGAGIFSPEYADLPASPLFPFGHGLSYTRFTYDALRLSPEVSSGEGEVEIGLRVSNTGDCAGDEVVQLYVQDPVASVTRPVQQLAGFVRVPLEAGESRHVVFRLHPSQLAFFDRAMRPVVEPGEFRVRVGASSEDIRLEGSFRFEGETRPISPREWVPTAVAVTREG